MELEIPLLSTAPDFVDYCWLQQPSMSGFFYCSSENYREKLRYVSVDDEHGPVVQPSACLGFLLDPAILCDSGGSLLHWETSWNERFISNPVTQEVISLAWDFERSEFFACGIACDSTHFEIVVLVRKPKGNLEPSIFNSETTEWTKSKEIITYARSLVPYEGIRGIFLEGSLYWETKQNKILCYQVQNRSARIIKLPRKLKPNYSQERGCLGMRYGKLHYGRIIKRILSIWVYSDGIDRWEEQERIDLANVDACSCPIQLLCFGQECEGVWMTMGKKKIVHWCFDGGIKDSFEVQREGSSCVGPSLFFPFVHSFAYGIDYASCSVVASEYGSFNKL